MTRQLTAILLLIGAAATVHHAAQTTSSADANEQLFAAARAGDTAQIASALERGADINATARYNMTALQFAAGSGRLDAVKLLVARGANLHVEDTFYRVNAAVLGAMNGHNDIAIFLLQSGSRRGNALLSMGVQSDNAALVTAALGSDVTRPGLEMALGQAERLKRTALAASIKTALDKLPAEPAPTFAIDPATLGRYAGTYRAGTDGMTLTVTVQEGALVAQAQGQPTVRLVPSAADTFRVREIDATLTFSERGGLVESINLVQGPSTLLLTRVNELAPAATPPAGTVADTRTPPPATAARAGKPRNWPSFRGNAADGNGDGQRIVTEWDVASGKNIRWKTAIPGIANSSPIVWGTRVFVTTAVTKTGDQSFRTGLYGDVKPVDDLSEHEFKIYALDKTTGTIVWERIAFAGQPKTKRHTKATQANSTPVTDGRRIVAVFGSIGLLIAWDMNGKELWRADLGVLDSGWFLDPSFQWGHSSSPIIFRNSVIVQSDIQKASYIAAWDLSTGKPLWKTPRADEIPTWGTPAIVAAGANRYELVTNGTKVRGYDPTTGKLLWTLGPNSEVTVGSPVAGYGLVFVTGGYPPVRPVYAIRPGGTGDISLPKGTTSNQAIAWSNSTEGTYIPSPIVYGSHLITMNNNGVITGYDAETGQRAFRGRASQGGAFSASPVAADGRLYVSSEDGEIFVLAIGPDLKPIAKNDMKEVIMATPAISDGLLVVRTLGHVYGIGAIP